MHLSKGSVKDIDIDIDVDIGIDMNIVYVCKMDRDIDIVDALVYLKIICLLVLYCITQFGPLGFFHHFFFIKFLRRIVTLKCFSLFGSCDNWYYNH